jgi:hypothetical protein
MQSADPNADVVYAMSYLDLKEDGPLVVQAPPGILGTLSDFWQRPLTDVGLAGPDKGEGGQYLLLRTDRKNSRRFGAADSISCWSSSRGCLNARNRTS